MRSLLLLPVLLAACFAEPSTRQVIEESTLKSIFTTGKYNVYIRPKAANASDGPVAVDIDMYVLTFDKVSHRDNTFDVQLYFRQEWVDDRLKYDDHQGQIKAITLSDPHALWTPDLFFVNEKAGHVQNIMKTNNFIKIMPNGKVLYSVRLMETLYCPMDLKEFPFDEQVCSLNIESYGYQRKDVHLRWKGDKASVSVAEDGIVPEFRLEQVNTEEKTEQVANAEYGRLSVTFTIKRVPMFYFIQVYIPSMTIILISWLTFWMHPKTNVARALVVLSSVLMMFFLSISNRKLAPRMNGATALDTWCGVCMTFVFAALIEFVYVSRKNYDEVKEEAKKLDKEQGVNTQQLYQLILFKLQKHGHVVDNFSKVLFPLAFVLFNVVYWPVAL